MNRYKKYELLKNALTEFAKRNELEIYFYFDIDYIEFDEIKFHCRKEDIVTPIYVISIDSHYCFDGEKTRLDNTTTRILNFFNQYYKKTEAESSTDNISEIEAELEKLSEETDIDKIDILRGALKLYRCVEEFNKEK